MADSNDMNKKDMNWDELEWKDWFDAKMRIVDHYSHSCDARMGNSWKISLGLWSSLGLLAGALITARVSIGNEVLPWVGLVALVVVFAVFCWWICRIGKDNIRDAKRMRRTLSQVTGGKEVPPPTEGKECCPLPRRMKRFLRVYYSQIFQGFITAVLMIFVVGAYFLATSGKSEQILNTECTSLNAKCVINNGEMKWLNKH